MPRSTIRLLSGLAAVVLVPVSVGVMATGAQAGEFTTDPSYDFDCDNKRDAIDAEEWETVDGREQAGQITVALTSAAFMRPITQATAGIAGSPEEGDNFGSTITAYDENGDGCDDLVVGAPNEDVESKVGTEEDDAGMVWIIPGSRSGLKPKASKSFHLDTTGFAGAVGWEDNFGSVLAAGTSTEGPFLVVGAPYADGGGSAPDAGAAYYLRGGKTHRLTQDTTGVAGKAEYDDEFGGSIAVSDRYIAIGAPGEVLGEYPEDQVDAGMAHVFSHKLVDGHLKHVGAFHQDTPGISGDADGFDRFGDSLSVVAYRQTSGGPIVPLVSVGTPREGDDAGFAQLVVVNSSTTYTEIAAVNEDTEGVPGEVNGDERFGADAVLAIRGSATVGSPATTVWAVTASDLSYEPAYWRKEVRVFRLAGEPTDDVVLIKDRDHDLELGDASLQAVDASAKYLYFEFDRGEVHGVPWGNILDGESKPKVVYSVWE